jgi:hypothetical protein
MQAASCPTAVRLPDNPTAPSIPHHVDRRDLYEPVWTLPIWRVASALRPVRRRPPKHALAHADVDALVVITNCVTRLMDLLFNEMEKREIQISNESGYNGGTFAVVAGTAARYGSEGRCDRPLAC